LQTSKRRKQNGKHKGVIYEDTNDVSEGEGDDGRPLWRMELKDGPALTSGLGLPQNQIMDSGWCCDYTTTLYIDYIDFILLIYQYIG